jgi:superfamily II DNA/RNA helicase
MPQKKQGGAARAGQNPRTPARSTGGSTAGSSARAGAPGSRSPKHRGYRPEEAAASASSTGKKPRWSRDERVERGRTPERSAPSRDDARDEKRGTDRARAGRDAAPARGTTSRSTGARAGASRATARDGAERTGTGRAVHRPEWRPKTGAARPARAEHPARDERPARPARDARDARPARDARDARDARPARDTRPTNAPRTQREQREARPSSFYPDRTATAAATDVVLDRLAARAVEAADVEGVTFADLGLGANIVRTLADFGAEHPFPIQAATIPDVHAGRDVLGRGRTGSGKTIAFGAPLVERLLQNRGGTRREMGRAPRALILAPTRELALQIDATVQPIARSVGQFTTQIYGGVPQGRQVGALQRGVDIIIGTPGRIEDLVKQGRLDLSQIEIVVLDEADHMCELGFLEPVQRIIRRTRTGGQRLLFSATLDSGVASLVAEFLTDPAVYEVAGEDQRSSTIDHRVLLVEQREKRAVIEQLVAGPGKTLVFARTRAFAEELADQLDDAGIAAVSLHGDLNQARRTRNLEKLTSGRVRVLVATDVAARGIHVDDISLVVQADAPDEYKTYLHRSGRTGRAGKPGTVVTLITRPRARRFGELLERAEIEAETTAVRAGDRLLDELAAL